MDNLGIRSRLQFCKLLLWAIPDSVFSRIKTSFLDLARERLPKFWYYSFLSGEFWITNQRRAACAPQWKTKRLTEVELTTLTRIGVAGAHFASRSSQPHSWTILNLSLLNPSKRIFFVHPAFPYHFRYKLATLCFTTSNCSTAKNFITWSVQIVAQSPSVLIFSSPSWHEK